MFFILEARRAGNVNSKGKVGNPCSRAFTIPCAVFFGIGKVIIGEIKIINKITFHMDDSMAVLMLLPTS